MLLPVPGAFSLLFTTNPTFLLCAVRNTFYTVIYVIDFSKSIVDNIYIPFILEIRIVAS
jgi:hypothetical protein